MPCSVGTAAMLGECSSHCWSWSPLGGSLQDRCAAQPSHLRPIGCFPAKRPQQGMERLELSADAVSGSPPSMESIQSWVGRGSV